MNRWLAFGLSGQVGAMFRAQCLAADAEIHAVSRFGAGDGAGIRWLRGSLQAPPDMVGSFDAVVSLGPLDAFAQWFGKCPLRPARVVVLGSTSVHGKRDSPVPSERRLVASLEAAESSLDEACRARGSALTVLRPTLIYGQGRDQNLSRMVAMARRWHCLPLPRSARGLRQPVHAADVAAAVLAALRAAAPVPGHFDLPGGETLPFDVMVARTLAVAAPGARLLSLPGPLFAAGVHALRLAGKLGDAGEGMLHRLDRDLAYDATPATKALGYRPRPYQPTAEDFPR